MKRLSVVVAVGLLCVALGAANADPMVSIHTQQDWDRALGTMGAGMIVPLGGMEFEQMVRSDMGWPQEYQEASFFTPLLETVSEYDGHPGLVMSWGPVPQGQEGYQAAAWDYVYAPLDNHDGGPVGLQPGFPVDLNGQLINFSILPPWPSTMFSLNLVDKNGNYREWIWHASGIPGAGDPVPGQWNTVTINPATGWSNFGNAIMWDNTPSFDLGSISILRFDENVPWPPPAGWPQGPLPGPVPGADWAYNLWNHVEVSPEPGTMALVGSGLLVLLRRRRRKK